MNLDEIEENTTKKMWQKVKQMRREERETWYVDPPAHSRIHKCIHQSTQFILSDSISMNVPFRCLFVHLFVLFNIWKCTRCIRSHKRIWMHFFVYFSAFDAMWAWEKCLTRFVWCLNHTAREALKCCILLTFKR